MRQKAVTRVGGWVVSVMLSLCVGSVHFNPLVAVQVPGVRSPRYPPSSDLGSQIGCLKVLEFP